MYLKTSDQPVLDLGIGEWQCNWGVHICGLYETEAERDEIIFGFLGRGIAERELCLYCHSERTEEDFKKRFSETFPDLADQIFDSDPLILMEAKDLYYPSGTFSPWEMEKNLGAFYLESQKNGRRNVRATAEMVWALEAIPGAEYLMAYESRLNYFIPGKPWISICLYNITKFPGDVIMNVLRVHPYTISKNVITRNLNYQDPDIWLRQNAPVFLNPV